MPPRTSWKGFLRLSLVSVPVNAYTANATGSEIRLNQLHTECHSRIQYKKTCPAHGEVGNDEIVKGYEYAKDQYVVIDPDELAKLRVMSDKTINLEGFIASDAIDSIHHTGKTYYLTPDGVAGEKPYVLLMETMAARGLHALARMVISGREQLVLLRPYEDLLALTVLAHHDSVKSVAPFSDEIPDAEFSAEEKKLTETLVDASLITDLDFSSYVNEYVAKMKELIEAKVAGQELVTAPSQEEPKILNLMEALKQSVASAEEAAPKKAPAKKKMAASARKKKAATKRKRKSG
ncbi:MAG: non-homologous end joining protein Ku [Planctomycetota bacterium]|jgi:DNA end-binding protein Ku